MIKEEQEAEELMAEMESMDPEGDEFLHAFKRLRTAVNGRRPRRTRPVEPAPRTP